MSEIHCLKAKVNYLFAEFSRFNNIYEWYNLMINNGYSKEEITKTLSESKELLDLKKLKVLTQATKSNIINKPPYESYATFHSLESYLIDITDTSFDDKINNVTTNILGMDNFNILILCDHTFDIIIYNYSGIYVSIQFSFTESQISIQYNSKKSSSKSNYSFKNVKYNIDKNILVSEPWILIKSTGDGTSIFTFDFSYNESNSQIDVSLKEILNGPKLDDKRLNLMNVLSLALPPLIQDDKIIDLLKPILYPSVINSTVAFYNRNVAETSERIFIDQQSKLNTSSLTLASFLNVSNLTDTTVVKVSTNYSLKSEINVSTPIPDFKGITNFSTTFEQDKFFWIFCGYTQNHGWAHDNYLDRTEALGTLSIKDLSGYDKDTDQCLIRGSLNRLVFPIQVNRQGKNPDVTTCEIILKVTSVKAKGTDFMTPSTSYIFPLVKATGVMPNDPYRDDPLGFVSDSDLLAFASKDTSLKFEAEVDIKYTWQVAIYADDILPAMSNQMIISIRINDKDYTLNANLTENREQSSVQYIYLTDQVESGLVTRINLPIGNSTPPLDTPDSVFDGVKFRGLRLKKDKFFDYQIGENTINIPGASAERSNNYDHAVWDYSDKFFFYGDIEGCMNTTINNLDVQFVKQEVARTQIFPIDYGLNVTTKSYDSKQLYIRRVANCYTKSTNYNGNIITNIDFIKSYNSGTVSKLKYELKYFFNKELFWTQTQPIIKFKISSLVTNQVDQLVLPDGFSTKIDTVGIIDDCVSSIKSLSRSVSKMTVWLNVVTERVEHITRAIDAIVKKLSSHQSTSHVIVHSLEIIGEIISISFPVVGVTFLLLGIAIDCATNIHDESYVDAFIDLVTFIVVGIYHRKTLGRIKDFLVDKCTLAKQKLIRASDYIRVNSRNVGFKYRNLSINTTSSSTSSFIWSSNSIRSRMMRLIRKANPEAFDLMETCQVMIQLKEKVTPKTQSTPFMLKYAQKLSNIGVENDISTVTFYFKYYKEFIIKDEKTVVEFPYEYVINQENKECHFTAKKLGIVKGNDIVELSDIQFNEMLKDSLGIDVNYIIFYHNYFMKKSLYTVDAQPLNTIIEIFKPVLISVSNYKPERTNNSILKMCFLVMDDESRKSIPEIKDLYTHVIQNSEIEV
ncbi:spike protein [Diaphorina citri reovirus]|nr:spike protein [Diaphorina citri reovirus]